MIRFYSAFCAMAALAVLLAAAPAEAQWGSLKGKFVYDGPVPAFAKLNIDKDVEVCGKHNLVDEALSVAPDGSLLNVVIYVRTKGVQVHPDYAASASAKVVYDNKNCRFEPHILPMALTQTIVLRNSDPVGHNSNVQPLGDQGINPLIPSGGEIEHKFFRAQLVPVQVTCNIHPWMKGYVLPRDNPYFAISGKDGSFEIKNLPVGELEFQAWHEKVGYLTVNNWDKGRFKATISAAGVDLGTIKCPAALFTK